MLYDVSHSGVKSNLCHLFCSVDWFSDKKNVALIRGFDRNLIY